ncbi:uncharacterized protein G2W53_015192 [Senna tora]|uniref:Uncharacterized protein n=1 Tax=Senna tora TaxID=362788 RepID=A0A835C590_9FABA|nr:uncharacterized protein G2W53_015192 [Senna tora]
MAIGQISQRRRLVASDFSVPSSRCIKFLGVVISLQQILLEKTQKCFGRVKEKKPPPPQKRKCLVWRESTIKVRPAKVMFWEEPQAIKVLSIGVKVVVVAAHE